MPYKDPKKRRDYAKQYARELRKIERDLIRKIRAMDPNATKVRTKRKKRKAKKK